MTEDAMLGALGRKRTLTTGRPPAPKGSVASL